jgi:2-phosphosulfolactate phosphatase
MIVTRRRGIAGAAAATGPTIVIDVFRAFSAAAYALAAGAEQIVLTETVPEAVEIAQSTPNATLIGEVDGVQPDEFDLGNSPGEILAQPERIAGKTVIHRSTSGTRCARLAFANGAGPLYVAGLVVASATARALARAEEVTIIASGIAGIGVAAEDEICGDVITELLLAGQADVAAASERVANHERAATLRKAWFTHPDDVLLCTVGDRFDFAMQARRVSDRLIVNRV